MNVFEPLEEVTVAFSSRKGKEAVEDFISKLVYIAAHDEILFRKVMDEEKE
jgi:hypothetical protein